MNANAAAVCVDSADEPAVPAASPLALVFAYHERSKHRLDRYAAGPAALDWDAQPDPFRFQPENWPWIGRDHRFY